MSKALRHLSGPALQAAVRRRLAAKTMGCGYWAAYDYHNRKMIKEAKQHGVTV